MTWWQRVRRFLLTFLPAKTVQVSREMCISCEVFACEDCYSVDEGWGCCCGRIEPEPENLYGDEWDGAAHG